jgi:putative NADH-flavin reductase
MRITILAANGKTGALLVQQALDRGHEVTALVRREGTLTARPGLHIVIGDATRAADVAAAAKGTDVVISALGQGSKVSSLMTDAVTAVIQASKDTGVTRFVLLSGIMVNPARLSFANRLMARGARDMFADKARSEALLRGSDLEWVIVYPPLLTGKPLGSGLRIVPDSEKIGVRHTLGRADLAAWMLDEAEKNEHLRGEVVVSK